MKKYFVTVMALVLLFVTVNWTCHNLTFNNSSPSATTPADVVGQSHVRAAATTTELVQASLSLDEQIAAAEQDLRAKEAAIQNDGIVEKLNRRDLPENERQAYFDQIQDAARTRLHDIELRLQRVQKQMREKGGA